MSIDPQVVGYTAAVLTTLSFAPQALLTLRTRNTRNLSLAMYSMFVAGVAVWLYYGLLREDYVVVAANAVTFLLSFPIFAMKAYNTVTRRDPNPGETPALHRDMDNA